MHEIFLAVLFGGLVFYALMELPSITSARSLLGRFMLFTGWAHASMCWIEFWNKVYDR